MSGVAPWRSGLYQNTQPLRQVMPDVTLIPRHFSNHGYHSSGSGKILHYVIDPPSWDAYFPAKEGDDPFPFTLYPEKRPVSLPRGGPWQYGETDWGPLDCSDEEFGGDHAVSGWVAEQLAQPPEKPFFLACGIYRPHEPWFVPRKYFEPFPIDEIQLPPGYRADDLDDVPPAGRKLARNRYFPHILWHGEWRAGVQGYLASIHFADAMLGRVLDALEKSPRRDNTIVVLWGDHGWHLGEKEHWQKFTGWRACTRVPFLIAVPPGCPGLPEGTMPGRRDQPVSTFDTFRTLLTLTGVPDREDLPVDGRDLTPLLADPDAEWPHVAITQLDHPGDFAVSGKDFRYIHYRNGGEELYDIRNDPYEHVNLAGDAAHAATLDRMRQSGPQDPEPLNTPEALAPELALAPRIRLTRDVEAPPSVAEGAAVPVIVRNMKSEPVRLLWLDPDGRRESRGEMAKASQRLLRTHVGATWLVEDAEGKLLGHFVVPPKGVQVKVE
jgi:arylsulfatase A-like enzyme